MDTQQLRQFEQNLVDEFFAALNQQAQTPAPLQIAAPQAAEPPRPYYAGPSQQQIDRQKIEAQLRALVEASTVRLYEMLTQRLDEMQAQQARIAAAALEVEKQALERERAWQLARERERAWQLAHDARRATLAPPCTPSRNNLY